MEGHTFERFRRLIHEKCGIVLSDEKRTLLQNRIQRRLLQLGLREPQAYLEIVETDMSGHELIQLIDAISTNTTSFYREAEHFDIFAREIERFNRSSEEEMRVWCAAASSGEEPYTIALTLLEHLDWSRKRARILATDISMKVLHKAIAGTYSSELVRRVPAELRSRYFSPASDGMYSVHPKARELILFKRLNLMDTPYPLNGPFDVIFCRNVMIYFDVPSRAKIVAEAERLLRPEGLFIISLSESLVSVKTHLEREQASTYRRRRR